MLPSTPLRSHHQKESIELLDGSGSTTRGHAVRSSARSFPKLLHFVTQLRMTAAVRHNSPEKDKVGIMNKKKLFNVSFIFIFLILYYISSFMFFTSPKSDLDYDLEIISPNNNEYILQIPFPLFPYCRVRILFRRQGSFIKPSPITDLKCFLAGSFYTPHHQDIHLSPTIMHHAVDDYTSR